MPYPHLEVNIYIPLRYDFKTDFVCYNLNEVLYCIMFTRLYFLYRAIFNYTPYENSLARKFCLKNDTKANVRFSFKCLVIQHPIIVVIFVILIPFLLILGIIVRVFERPITELTKKMYENPLNSIWAMFQSMSGLGLGDAPPSTYAGKVIFVFGYWIGAILFALIIIYLQKQVEFTGSQTRAFRSIYKTKPAALCIQAAMSYFLTKSDKGRYHSYTATKYDMLRTRIFQFKEHKFRLCEMNTSRDVNILELKDSVNKLNDEMGKMESAFAKLSQVVSHNLIKIN